MGVARDTYRRGAVPGALAIRMESVKFEPAHPPPRRRSCVFLLSLRRAFVVCKVCLWHRVPAPPTFSSPSAPSTWRCLENGIHSFKSMWAQWVLVSVQLVEQNWKLTINSVWQNMQTCLRKYLTDSGPRGWLYKWGGWGMRMTRLEVSSVANTLVTPNHSRHKAIHCCEI